MKPTITAAALTAAVLAASGAQADIYGSLPNNGDGEIYSGPRSSVTTVWSCIRYQREGSGSFCRDAHTRPRGTG